MRDERERECNRHLNDILTYLSEFIVASCLRIIPHLFTISLGLVLFFSFLQASSTNNDNVWTTLTRVLSNAISFICLGTSMFTLCDDFIYIFFMWALASNCTYVFHRSVEGWIYLCQILRLHEWFVMLFM